MRSVILSRQRVSVGLIAFAASIAVGLASMTSISAAASTPPSFFGCSSFGLMFNGTSTAVANGCAGDSSRVSRITQSAGGTTLTATGLQSRTRFINGRRTGVARSRVRTLTITDSSGDIITARNLVTRVTLTCTTTGQHTEFGNTGRVGTLTINGTTYHPGSAQQTYTLAGGFLNVNSMAQTHFPVSARLGLVFFGPGFPTVDVAVSQVIGASFTCS